MSYVGEALRWHEARSIVDDVAGRLSAAFVEAGIPLVLATQVDDYNVAVKVFRDCHKIAQERREAVAEAEAAQVAAEVHASQFVTLGSGPDVGAADVWSPGTVSQAVTAHVDALIAQDRFERARVRLARAEAVLKLARDHMGLRFEALVAKTKADARRAFDALSDE